jgi:hypothetical protein
MYMPFGKYRGEPMESLPRSYLLWLLENIDNSQWVTREAWRLLAEYLHAHPDAARQCICCRRHRAEPAEPEWGTVRRLVTDWHREIALRWHPDRGGNGAIMAALNDAVDRLKARLEDE